ncbi:MAG: low-specificity L-threonine aldolase [Bacteroidetes bacterium]|nr:low-specificity L-threonine aldolase [Bacteroidota bacterium]
MEKIIDIRSDTVTKPTTAMRQAMANAEVGDDVFGEDPTVNILQEKVASLLGKEKALFVPSGCMSNQLAIKAHTNAGDEILVERDAHIFNYETAAPSVMSSVQVQTVPGKKGIFSVEQLPSLIRPDIYYMPKTKLIAVENTHNRAGGTIFPLEEINKLSRFAKERNIIFHLDGARLWNASVATGIPMKTWAEQFDSVSVCFSKGLGAPVGSAICGSAEFISKVRKWRKVFGGGMRQAGIIAAGALYAVENHVERLKEDHQKAKYFAEELSSVTQFSIDLESVQTNIILIDVQKTGKTPNEIISLLKANSILVSSGTFTSLRAVMHLDVSMEEIRYAVQKIKALFH